jgi:hypothetical protein
MKKRDGSDEGLDRYFMRKFEELGIDAHSLRIEIEELRMAEKGLKMTEKELRDTRQFKEAELKRLILQKRLSS